MFQKIKMNEADANLTQGGAGAPNPTTPPNPAPTQAQGGIDDGTKAINDLYGTKPVPTKVESSQEGVPTKTTQGDPATGYVAPPAGDGTGYKPPEGEQRPTEKDAPVPTENEKLFDEAGMTKEQIDAVKNFAAANKLTKEALNEYVTLSKAAKNNVEVFKAEQMKAAQAAQAKQRSEWYNSLKTDKDFGGEHFETNLKRVDTVLEKFFPNTKNMLTKAKGMLPPDVMKDMQSIHKLLLGQEGSLVNPGAQTDAGLNDDEKFLKNYYK